MSSACAHGDHKTAATIYHNVISRLFGIGHVTVGIFAIGNESIVKTNVSIAFCCQHSLTMRALWGLALSAINIGLSASG
jgi:hypothetical protein